MAATSQILRNLRMRPVSSAMASQRRFLNLHEFQSLQIFKDHGVAVPQIAVVKKLGELDSVADQFPGDVVVKSQVLAGGRGLGHFKENGFQGGVHVTGSRAELKEKAEKMLGKTLITKQTGEAGKPNNFLMLAEKFTIKDEKYFAILMDRASGGPIMIGSKVGGTSIEDIAEADPTAIIKVPVDIMKGLSKDTALDMVTKMGWSGDAATQAADCVMGLYDTFISCDCTMVEINPLAELDDGRVIVCDAKVGFDDNAFFRQKEIFDQRDESQEDPRDVEAAKWDLNYIGLDGSIACMVNGAGLAMATMDLLNHCGGSPANFLDVGGSAEVGQIKAAFTIVENDPNVKAVLINIFGGIMRCDVVAEGVVQASKELNVTKPIVIRLVGTNVDEGKKIIKDSGLAVYPQDDLNKAANLAVELAAKA